MDRRGTQILVLVALLLITFLVLRNMDIVTLPGEVEPTEIAAEEFISLYPQAQGDTVVAFEFIENETGNVFAAQKNDDASWTITEMPSEAPEEQVVDSFALDTAISPLPTLGTTRQIPAVENLLEFGLESPAYMLTFQTASGNTFELEIGSKNPQGVFYYVRVPGATDISLISASTLDTFVTFFETPPFAIPTATPIPLPTAVPISTPTPSS